MAEGPQQPSEQDVREFLEAIARTRVADVVVQTAFTLSSVASARLGIAPETRAIRDLGEARAAIDTLVSLAPVLQTILPPDEFAEFRQSLGGLQMAYAQVARDSGEPAPPPPPPGGPQQRPPEPPPRPETPPRPEPPRPKIWTPRGDV
jgi:Domain of unknown function (DUF1844)